MQGLILLNKPQSMTSFAAVAQVRRLYGEKRAGHTGTLDPMATGVLPILLGKATRLSSFMLESDKRYTATVILGVRTDTLDITGKVISTQEHTVDDAQMEAALARFRGKIKQMPPMYSALKVDGRKLVDLARQGVTVERKAREIEIFELEAEPTDTASDYLLAVKCSGGTYIRTLCADIGAALGCGGTMASLRRVRCGVFSVADACTVGEANESRLLPLDSLFSDREAATLSRRAERFCRCGSDFALEKPDGEYRLYAESGEFLALGRAENGRGRVIKSFYEVNG